MKKKEVAGTENSRLGGEFEMCAQAHILEVRLSSEDRVLAQELGIDITLPVHELADRAIDNLNRSALLIVQAGLLLLAAKESCEHGEWLPLLESRGLARERSAEVMRYAKFAGRLSPAERRKVLELPKKKVLALAAAEPETVDELLDSDEEFDAVTALSPTEMRRKLKVLEGQKATLEGRLELKERELRQERERRVERTQPYPEFVTIARRESNALAEKARLCLDDLAQIHADHGALQAVHRGDKRTMEYWESAAAAIYFNVRAVAAQAVALIQKLEAELPESVTGEVTAAYFYDKADIENAARDRMLVVQVHAHEKALRQQSPDTDKRPVGRPRKGRA